MLVVETARLIEALHVADDANDPFFMYADEEEVGTIVQDIHGIDYELVYSALHKKKYWDLFADSSLSSTYTSTCYHEHALCIAEASRLRNRACNSFDEDLQEGFIKFMKKQLINLSTTQPTLTMREKTAKIRSMWAELSIF
jgi:hypothetical protein